jgi:hypothetical protein
MVSGADYQIKISSEADLSALKATLAALESDTAAAERMGVSVKGAYDQIAATKSAINGYENAVKNAHNELSKLDISHREVHQAMRLVSQAAGGALGPIGELTHLLGNPYIMAAAGATLAIKMLIEEHQKLHDITVKNIEESRNLANAMRDAGENAARINAQHVADLANHFAHLQENVDLATHAMEVFIKVNAATLASQEANITATTTLIAAYIHEQEVLGHFNAPEAGFMTQHAENEEAKQKQREKEAKEQTDIDVKTQRANKAKQEGEEAQRLATGLTKGRRSDAQDALEAINAVVDSLSQKLPDLDKAANEAQADLPTLRDAAASAQIAYEAQKRSGGDSSIAGFLAEKAANAFQDALGAIGAADSQRDSLEKAKRTQARFEQDLKDIDEEIAHQKQIADARLELFRTTMEGIEDARRQLKQEHDDFTRDESTREETQRVKRRSALEEKKEKGAATPGELAELFGMTDSGPGAKKDLAAIVAKAKALAEALAKQKPADRSQDDLAQLHAYFDTMLGFAENANVQIRTLATKQNEFDGRIAELLAQQRTIDQRLSNGPYTQ